VQLTTPLVPGGLLGFVLTTVFGAALGTVYVTRRSPRPFILSARFAADAVLLLHTLVL
jgi:hypothetical protein